MVSQVTCMLVRRYLVNVTCRLVGSNVASIGQVILTLDSLHKSRHMHASRTASNPPVKKLDHRRLGHDAAFACHRLQHYYSSRWTRHPPRWHGPVLLTSLDVPDQR
jgi:hypothetical protein